MTDSVHQVSSLFHAALERSPPERDAFVDASSGGDSALAGEVKSLLRAHAAGTIGLLRDAMPVEHAAITAASRSVGVRAGSEVLGRRIGPYLLVREIARGGMSVVYLARRADGAYEQQVVVKLISAGGARLEPRIEADLARRFQGERQVLASLDHPSVTKLFDGGTTEDGVPYLVMEYVDGLPIDAYCDAHALPVVERLRLFRDVCLAVQFVHEKLVAHRDLKPSNILVEPPRLAGGAPTPKLLDFGIAKLCDPALRATTELKRLTPAYASPEQFRGEPATAASDVYSLGVVLYELLVGRLPYDLETADTREVARIVCERAPIAPSTLRPGLAGDLETLLLTALEKDPGRRYASAAALAADIDRFLTGYPLRARPAGRARRIAKAIARNRVAFAAASVFVASLLASSVWISVLYVRSIASEKLAEERRTAAVAAQARAEQHSREADANAALLQRMFASPDPYEQFGRDVKVVDVLDHAAVQLAEGIVDQPLTRASLEATLGWTQYLLGRFDHADPLLAAALAKREALLDPSHEQTIASRNDLALLRHRQHRFDESERLHRENLGRARDGGMEEWAATAAHNLASLVQLRGDVREADALFRESIAARRRLLGDAHPDTVIAEQNFALLLHQTMRFDEAEELARRVLAARERADPPNPLSTAEARRVLGQILRDQGELDEARSLLDSAVSEMQRLRGDEHHWVGSTLAELGALHLARGRFEESEALLDDALQIALRRKQDGVTHMAFAAAYLGYVFDATGRYEDAQAVQRGLAAITARSFGLAHTNTITTMENLSVALEKCGAVEEAGRWHALTAHAADASLVDDDPTAVWVHANYGSYLLRTRRLDEAERELLRAHRACPLKVDAPQSQRVLQQLVQLYAEQGRADAAAHYRALLEPPPHVAREP